MYEKIEDVKMENKFAPASMRIPLIEEPADCLQSIKKETAKLKKSFGVIYFMYFFADFTALLVSDFVKRIIADDLTRPFTLAFSNTPGLLRPIQVRETKVNSMATIVAPQGRVGLCIAIISYFEDIRVTGLADSSVLSKQELRKLVNYINEAIQRYIEIGKQLPPIDEEPKKDK